MTNRIKIPRRSRGRPSPKATAKYEAELQEFAERILQIRSRLDFAPSSRGWCYMLEELAGLTKDRFSEAEKVVCECRKRGILPLDITAVDGARTFANEEYVFEESPQEHAERLLSWARNDADNYFCRSFWEDQPCYVQMLVEKIDLKQLFQPVCEPYRIRLANARGWSDVHSRASLMQEFACWEAQGKTPVLLYCGDFDPAGVPISDQTSE